DLLALTGDAVDNVKGVPGIGPKTASKLLEEFGSLENLLQNASKVPGKKGQALADNAEVARLGLQLVKLRDDIPLSLDWSDLEVAGYDATALKTLCVECGFHRFLDEIEDGAAPPETAWDTSAYKVIDTPDAFSEFLQKLKAQKQISFDTETTALDPLRADLVGLSFCWKEGDAYYLPVRGPMGSSVLDVAKVLEGLRPIFEDPSVEFVGQNLKYDLLVLSRYDLTIAGPITDTMVLSYLLESGERNHNLDELSRRLLGHTMIPISDLIGKGRKQITMDLVEIPKITEYAGEDADAAWRLAAILEPKVRAEGLWDLYADLERPLISVLARMEGFGVRVDCKLLKRLSEEFAERLESIKSEIHALAGHEFNIGSGPQLRQVLFEEQNLPVIKKTPKGEPSTDAEVLEELAPKHPLPALIVQHRQLDKLKGTYLDALPTLADENDRIHASFNQVVTATGRLSSSDPNLQNIPVRTEDGRQIRQAFIPGQKGWSLLSADYSQIELRVLAHFSQDPALKKAFADDLDIHSAVASGIFGVPESGVTPNQRRVAKTVNFGVIYGISGYGLATRLAIPQTEANAFIDAYFERYPGVADFMTRTLEAAKETGRVETILGRRRAVSGIKNADFRKMNVSERIAVNAVIQGSAADLIKRAMLAIDQKLRESKLQARMLLQIHDELVFEAPDAEIPELATLVRHEMTHALKFDIPIKVDVSAGPNWLDVKPV
ncbi:MAG TPA: DNA polymerase I, partial [Isosphaeraceae bacterium]|nr:DNA polymerase I [Isosphaeraceae bacterium]